LLLISREAAIELSLHHLVRQPETEGEHPLLILLLHGVGSNESDLFNLAQYLPPDALVISARAPLTLAPGQYGWYPVQFRGPGDFQIDAEMGRESVDRIKAFIAEACAAYNADPARVTLMGFSQGAIMSHAILNSSPERVARVVAMSGRVIPELFPQPAPSEALSGKPILITHGTRDGVIPIQYAREAEAHYQALPVTLAYHEYEMAHEINNAALQRVLDWLGA
jgi:phospholipase/carboxylesterase